MAQPDSSSPPPNTAGRWKGWALRALKWGLFGAVLFFVCRVLIEEFSSLSWEGIHCNVLLMTAGVFFVVVAKALSFPAYDLLLRRMGYRLPLSAMAAMVWMAQTAKYVPGKVGTVVSMVLLWGRYQIPGQVTVSTIFIVDGLSVIIGMVFAIPLTLFEPLRSSLPMAWLWCAGGILVALVCLHPRVLGWVGNLALRLLGYQPFSALPHLADYLWPTVAMLVQYLLLAVGYWLMARSMTPVSVASFPAFFSVVVVVTIAGFLAFFAPAGLGVQEGLILYLFDPTIGGIAAVLAVLVRLVQTLSEAFLAGVGAILLRRRRRLGGLSAASGVSPSPIRPLRVVVDISHPAHVHLFKYFIRQMREAGHEIMITASEKDVACRLLEAYGETYVNLGSYGRTVLRKVLGLPLMDRRMYRAVKPFDPDLLIGVSPIRAAHVAALLGRKCISLDDSEHAKWEVRLYLPFVTAVCTPSCYKKDLGRKQIRYEGFHELAYLHPNHFKPDPSIMGRIGLAPGERFVVVRFVSWGAVHDVGQHGFGTEGRGALIEALEKHARVFVVSEGPLDPRFEKNRLPVAPEHIHDLLYHAALYVGEGATMATEAGILGTPSVYLSSLIGTMGNFEELRDKYDLVHAYRSPPEAIEDSIRLLADHDLKARWREKRDKLLQDKTDVTQWLVDLAVRITTAGGEGVIPDCAMPAKVVAENRLT